MNILIDLLSNISLDSAEPISHPQHLRDHHNDSVADLSSSSGTFFSSFPAFDIAHLFNTCSRNNTNIMDKLLRDSSPFLFPCTIEYSLICAAVLYVMWKNIAEEHEHYKSQRRRRKINQKMIQNNVKPYGPNWALDDGQRRSGQHYT